MLRERCLVETEKQISSRLVAAPAADFTGSHG